MAEIPRTTLGRTGLSVTRLGIGGAYCETAEDYRAALDCGINYVDTARSYRDGDDERVIGKAIAGRRHELVVASKSSARDEAGARKDLETSLCLLGTDYLDVWQIHYLNTAQERDQVLGPGGAMEAAIKARKQGLIRYIGVTGHVWDEVGRSVDTGFFDTVLCWYNCAMKEPEELVFPQAQDHHTGVVIMNATRTNKLLAADDAPPIEDFYRYVLSHPAVSLAILGLRDLEEFEHVARALAVQSTLSPQSCQQLEAYGARLRQKGALD